MRGWPNDLPTLSRNPTHRAVHIRFSVHRLNHSATSSSSKSYTKKMCIYAFTPCHIKIVQATTTQESHSIFVGIPRNLPISQCNSTVSHPTVTSRTHRVCKATYFFITWHKKVRKGFLVVFHTISHLKMVLKKVRQQSERSLVNLFW